jgi:hypothetical protein
LPLVHQGADVPAHGIGALLQDGRDTLLIRQRAVLTQFQFPFQTRHPKGKGHDAWMILRKSFSLWNIASTGDQGRADRRRNIGS